MRKILVIHFILLLIPTSTLYSQDSTWNILAPTRFIPSVAYVYQGTQNIEFTIGAFGMQKKHNYFLLRAGVDIYKNDVWCIAPITSLVYRKEIKNFWGIIGSLHFWGKKIDDYQNLFLTPEIGFGHSIMNLSYGYNIPLSNSMNNTFSNHRISFRLGL